MKFILILVGIVHLERDIMIFGQPVFRANFSYLVEKVSYLMNLGIMRIKSMILFFIMSFHQDYYHLFAY